MIGLLRRLWSEPDPYEKALDAIRKCMQSGETELDLERLELTPLPPEIGQLTKLQKLYLRDNQLASLPAEIGQLTNLQGLDLTRNQLATLPPEIWQLTNLTYLHLGDNQFTTLPPFLERLPKLETPKVHNNPLNAASRALLQRLRARGVEVTGL